MSDEARNTDRRAFGWGSTPLRNVGIKFVSAGTLKKDEDAWNTVSEDDSPQKQSDGEPSRQPTVEDEQKEGKESVKPVESVELAEPAEPQQAEEQAADAEGTTQTVSSSVPDALADAPTEPTVATELRPATPSSDSEEEIVFAGRMASKQPSRRPTPAPPPVKQTDIVMNTISTVKSTYEKPSTVTTMTTQFSTTTISLDTPDDTPLNLQKPAHRSNGLPYGGKYDEEELMQDYIDNMALDDSEQEDGEASGSARRPFRKTETYRLFAGDGLENAKVQTISNGRKMKANYIPDQAFDWESDDLEVFDDVSTTDEEIEDVCQIVRHRERASGAQYLVVATNAEVSDAKWILHSRLVSESALNEIKIFEEIRAMNLQEEDDEDDEDEDSDEDEDEEALQDLIDNIDSEDDENARIMDYTARMTDEQIARALAKQEELGLGSDELILLDGDAAVGADSMEDDAFGMGDSFIPFSISKHTSNRGRTKRNKKQNDSFPSAEAFADALDQDPYGAFDIMDFERPSLRPKKKGRKSDFPFVLEGLEDAELRDNIIDTWTKDREKKAARKREKEAARLTASLDAADGSDPAVIKTQIRQFLVQDVDMLELSPMDAHIRAAVHRLAKALKLNSQSKGKEGLGKGRYPVLTKTPRTPCYTIETIWEIDALMNTRKFFPKNLHKSYKTTRQTTSTVKTRRGGGGVLSGVSFRDGEEVAASAPEIGADNRGRAMLEKMGWTAGMGIGAIGNKGGLDPIKHVIKTTKAGLG